MVVSALRASIADAGAAVAGGGSIDLEDDILAKPEPIEGLSDEERALLGEALRALRRERGKAWNAACDAAEAAGKRRPPLRPYGIDEIKRLARRLGIGPTHWTGEN